jgi:hypothetical protein
MKPVIVMEDEYPQDTHEYRCKNIFKNVRSTFFRSRNGNRANSSRRQLCHFRLDSLPQLVHIVRQC